MNVEGADYQLSAFRKWLLTNHEELVQNHFVKAVRVKGGVKFTYDWQHIYFIAEQYDFTKQFIYDHTSTSPKQIPGDMPSNS